MCQGGGRLRDACLSTHGKPLYGHPESSQESYLTLWVASLRPLGWPKIFKKKRKKKSPISHPVVGSQLRVEFYIYNLYQLSKRLRLLTWWKPRNSVAPPSFLQLGSERGSRGTSEWIPWCRKAMVFGEMAYILALKLRPGEGPVLTEYVSIPDSVRLMQVEFPVWPTN